MKCALFGPSVGEKMPNLPEEWAELFKKAGAQFAGPVAEHHDGFAMWDSEFTEWNAAKMGPERDVVGELKRAIRKRGLEWSLTGEGLEIKTPDEKPCEHAYVFKIVRGHPF